MVTGHPGRSSIRGCQADDDENDHDERQEQAIVVHFDEARLVARKFDFILLYFVLHDAQSVVLPFASIS